MDPSYSPLMDKRRPSYQSYNQYLNSYSTRKFGSVRPPQETNQKPDMVKSEMVIQIGEKTSSTKNPIIVNGPIHINLIVNADKELMLDPQSAKNQLEKLGIVCDNADQLKIDYIHNNTVQKSNGLPSKQNGLPPKQNGLPPKPNGLSRSNNHKNGLAQPDKSSTVRRISDSFNKPKPETSFSSLKFSMNSENEQMKNEAITMTRKRLNGSIPKTSIGSIHTDETDSSKIRSRTEAFIPRSSPTEQMRNETIIITKKPLNSSTEKTADTFNAAVHTDETDSSKTNGFIPPPPPKLPDNLWMPKKIATSNVVNQKSNAMHKTPPTNNGAHFADVKSAVIDEIKNRRGSLKRNKNTYVPQDNYYVTRHLNNDNTFTINSTVKLLSSERRHSENGHMVKNNYMKENIIGVPPNNSRLSTNGEKNCGFPTINKAEIQHEKPVSSDGTAKYTTVVPITNDHSNTVSKKNPTVKKLVYNTYRGLLGAYNDRANGYVNTLPKNMVFKDKGVNQQLNSIESQGCLKNLNGRINPKEIQEETSQR